MCVFSWQMILVVIVVLSQYKSINKKNELFSLNYILVFETAFHTHAHTKTTLTLCCTWHLFGHMMHTDFGFRLYFRLSLGFSKVITSKMFLNKN